MSPPLPYDGSVDLLAIKRYVNELAAVLPKTVQASALTAKSKLPFKALAIRELLAHRTVVLTNAAVELFEKANTVPAIILTRSVVETVAVLFELREQLEHFLKNDTKDFHALDKFLMERLMGSKNNPDADMPKATNILTIIGKVDKTFPDFLSVYGHLCEYAHPNWAGTFGSFGTAITEAKEIELLPNPRSQANAAGLSTLSGTLTVFQYSYKTSGELVQQLNDHIERNGMENTASTGDSKDTK